MLVIVKLNVPATVGVPLRMPVPGVKVIPVGMAPAEIESVFVPVPFAEVTVWL